MQETDATNEGGVEGHRGDRGRAALSDYADGFTGMVRPGKSLKGMVEKTILLKLRHRLQGHRGQGRDGWLKNYTRPQCSLGLEPRAHELQSHVGGFWEGGGNAVLAGTAQIQDICYMTWITWLALDVTCRGCEWGAPDPQEGHGEDSPIQRCTFQGFC